MRIHRVVTAMVVMTMASIAFASEETTKVMDDFTSSSPSKAWAARPDATVMYEKDGMRLSMPKYSGQEGEGQWPGMERSTAGLPLSEYNGLLIHVTNASDHRQPLGVGFHDGSNGSASMFEEVGPGEQRTVKIKFDRMISGTVDWSNIQRMTITWTTPSVPMVWVFNKIEFFRDDPANTELGQLQSLVKKAQEAFKRAKETGALTERQSVDAARTLAQWSEAARTSEGIRGKGSACRNELGAIQSRMQLAGLAKVTKGSMVAWSVPVGTRFEPSGAMLQFDKPLEKVQLYGAMGQYADAIVRVTNVSDEAQDWQVRVAGDSGMAQGISIRRNQAVVAADRSVVGDVLVPLDKANVVSVGAGETVELWVRGDLKHRPWKVGSHSAELEFKDLRRGVESIIKLPVELTVWGIDLNQAPGLRLNMWASLFWGNAPMLAGREEAALENLVDYGCNVLTINPGQMPWPKLSADGTPQGELDFTAFDKLVKLYRSKGDPIILVWLGLDDNHPDLQELKSNLKVYSPQWEKGLRWWVGQLMGRMKTLGVSADRYALYVTDEPNVSELDLTLKVAQVAKSIDPLVQIYMDSSELSEDAHKNEELMKLVDINQPNGDGMAARPYLLPQLKKYANGTLWLYQCRTNTRARQLVNAYDYYRLQAWQATSEGMKGIGFWVYAYYTRNDYWDGTTGSGGGADMVYPDSGNGLLMSVRYELIRMGLDDMKYYQLLKNAPHTAQGESLLGERFEQVRSHPHNPEMAEQWRIDTGKALAGNQ